MRALPRPSAGCLLALAFHRLSRCLTIALSRRQLRIWGEITCGSCPHLKIVASLEICSKSANSSALTVANKTNTAFSACLTRIKMNARYAPAPFLRIRPLNKNHSSRDHRKSAGAAGWKAAGKT